MQLFAEMTPALVKPTDVLPSEKLKGIAIKDPFMSVFAIASCYLIMLAAMAGFSYITSIYSSPLLAIPLGLLVILIIASRQFALTILMHEGAHYLLHPDKQINDRMSDWLCAFPLLNNTHAYRVNHFNHHWYAETEQDPDLWLSKRYPVSRASFSRKMFRDLTGIAGSRRVIAVLKSSFKFFKDGESNTESDSGQQPIVQSILLGLNKITGFLVTNAVVISIVSIVFNPLYYLVFWWVPLLTWYSFMYRIRYMAEHASVPAETPYDIARTTIENPLLRWLIAPFNVNYHSEHHLFPAVPWYRLPKVHKLLKEENKTENMVIAKGYIGVVKSLIKATDKDEKTEVVSQTSDSERKE